MSDHKNAAPAAPEAMAGDDRDEFDAWWDAEGDMLGYGINHKLAALRAWRAKAARLAPPQQCAEPVTDERIELMALEWVKKPGWAGYVEPGDLIDFARALLAQHGAGN